MSDNTIQREFVRSIVRGTYDIQKLRIQAGNRLTANYKIKLGIKPGKAEDEEKVASSILADIRKDYTRITDPIAAEALAKQGITPKKFKAEGMITNFLELSMANQYFILLKTEEDEFKNLGKVLEDVPIYKEFLSNIPGIGPQIAGVLISEIDIHKAEYPSSLQKYAGLDVIVIGKYTDKQGNEKTVRGDLIEAFYADGDYGKKMIIDGCMVELETVGRSRKGYSLVKREYETKDGQTASKDSITFNPWLKTKLIGVLAGNFLKQSAMLVNGKEMGAAKRTELAKSLGFKPTTKVELKPQKQVDQFLVQHGYYLEFVPGVYAEHYYNYKERLDNSPFHDEKTDLHKHNMALRFMIKRFLVDYYKAARELEGLPVALEYGEAKLGMVHGKAKGLPDFQGLIGHVVKKRYDPSLFDMPEGV